MMTIVCRNLIEDVCLMPRLCIWPVMLASVLTSIQLQLEAALGKMVQRQRLHQFLTHLDTTFCIFDTPENGMQGDGLCLSTSLSAFRERVKFFCYLGKHIIKAHFCLLVIVTFDFEFVRIQWTFVV